MARGNKDLWKAKPWTPEEDSHLDQMLRYSLPVFLNAAKEHLPDRSLSGIKQHIEKGQLKYVYMKELNSEVNKMKYVRMKELNSEVNKMKRGRKKEEKGIEATSPKKVMKALVDKAGEVGRQMAQAIKTDPLVDKIKQLVESGLFTKTEILNAVLKGG